MLIRCANMVEFVLKAIVLVLITLLVLLVFGQVVLRFVFSSGISWFEEVSRYLFVWSTLLSIAVAVKYNAHLACTFLADKSNKLRPWFRMVYYIACLLFFALIVYYGIIYTISGHGAKSSLLPIRLSIIYCAVPVGALLSIFFLLVQCITEAGQGRGKAL